MNNKLSKQTVILHWITGLLFIGVFILGSYVEGLPRSPEKFQLLGTHKSLGVIVLVIALARMIWRLKEGAIASVAQLTRAQQVASKAVHHLLLLATLMMPISGMMMSVGGGRGVDIFG